MTEERYPFVDDAGTAGRDSRVFKEVDNQQGGSSTRCLYKALILKDLWVLCCLAATKYSF